MSLAPVSPNQLMSVNSHLLSAWPKATPTAQYPRDGGRSGNSSPSPSASPPNLVSPTPSATQASAGGFFGAVASPFATSPSIQFNDLDLYDESLADGLLSKTNSEFDFADLTTPITTTESCALSPSLLSMESLYDSPFMPAPPLPRSPSPVYPVTESHALCQLATASIPGTLPPAIETQAACFFAANFVVLPTPTSRFGHLDFLLPLLRTTPSASPLIDAFSAVSLYSFASRPSHRDILPTANVAYVKALQSLNQAVRDPALKDGYATIASSLLLALIEVLSPSSTTPRIAGWPSHISGAASLLKAKGDDVLMNSVGRSIFRTVRHQITLDSITNSKEIEFGTDWWMSRLASDDILQDAAAINVEVAQLRADTNRMMTLPRADPAHVRTVTALLRAAQHLEPRSAAWFERLLQGGHACVTTPSPATAPPALFPRKLITFAGFSVAVSYMMACLTRFFILELILRCTAWLLPPGGGGGATDVVDYKHTPEYARCRLVGAEVVRSVVAAVPYFFHDGEGAGSTIASTLTFACGLGGGDAEVKGLSGMCCLWPVFSAAGSDFATAEQSDYLTQKLEYAGNHLGIQSSRIFLMVGSGLF